MKCLLFRDEPIKDRRALNPAVQVILKDEVEQMITSLCKDHAPSKLMTIGNWQGGGMGLVLRTVNRTE